MRKHILKFILSIVLISLIIFGGLETWFNYQRYCKMAEQELQCAADILSDSEKSPDEIFQQLKKSLNYNVRLTCIDFDGSVFYDSETKANKLQNHSQRKEFKEALKNGSGETSRNSETIGKFTYYYAVKTENGVYRFSREINTMFTDFAKTCSHLILMLAVIGFVSYLLSAWFSKKLVEPLNNISFSDKDGKVSAKYEELVPIADTISGLNRKLDKYMGRLKIESEKIALIFENMVEGLVILDSDGNIMSINKSAAAMMSVDIENADKLHISELIHDQNLLDAVSLKDDDRVQALAEIGNKNVCAYINKVEIASSVCIIMILADITGKKNAEELRREFSANVSHELKTPLTTIKGFGELFGSGMITEPEDIKKYGSRIERESQRLLFLINDIIRLSELEETNEIVTSNINLMASARETAELLAQKAEKAEVSIIFSGDDALCCNCNESYIRELFTNLIDNSIKYNKAGGYVKINISKSDNKAVISVKDNGIGIPEKDKDRIFERFYRVDKSHSRQTGGTGLGLSIVKHIVSYHNGTVTLESELGKGTEIKIYLPLNLFDEKGQINAV
ncbi:MAG: ATP-binding protein [Ruminococcus sp.]|nr:ATP-binding protein [Ruminococcus sp.]